MNGRTTRKSGCTDKQTPGKHNSPGRTWSLPYLYEEKVPLTADVTLPAALY